ncbi:molybdenum cofactor guanylyltransferase [Roseiarcus fermentans]|uniref:Molybdenum cofactor guanylyltransferase n=1 Tax=Roseiarcus fermentans TaxID=1473586 RepID=A0A366F9Q5_9HYPH|nr:molybdenum cofactor guanylyltransferase MobA [Roseiarcus fermentans]RBP11347.1 molybdenum cofactor guanylyltransferase [Roseiarcus fermentans]
MATTDTPATLGALLAGGRAQRMGGGDKALRAVGARPMLTRIVERLAPQCCALALNANGDPSRFAAFAMPVVPDDVPGFAGPLAGVLAVLDWTAARRPDVAWVASVATDTPFLPRDLVERLHRGRAAAGALLACAASGGRRHPVVGLWPVALRADLRRALVEEDIRRVDRLTARYPLAIVEWPTAPADPFFNANAPEDVAEAERLVALHPEL